MCPKEKGEKPSPADMKRVADAYQHSQDLADQASPELDVVVGQQLTPPKPAPKEGGAPHTEIDVLETRDVPLASSGRIEPISGVSGSNLSALERWRQYIKSLGRRKKKGDD